MNLPPYGHELLKENAVLSTLKATPQPIPDMTLQVSAGGFWYKAKQFIEYAGGKSPAFTAPATGAKWSLLVINNLGYLQTVDGLAGTNPEMPDCPRNTFAVKAIYLQQNATQITTENSFDLRPVFTSALYSHADMDDRDNVNQHPISAITNLQNEIQILK